MSEIFPETPITSLPTAVAFMGALPMKVGTEPQPLSAERLAEIRSLDLLALMDDRVAPVISSHLAVLLAEIDRLTAQRDRRRDRLVALQNDALNVRGALSPNGEARKVPMPLGPTLLPAVEWLIGRVAELEAERHETNEALDDAVQELRARQSCPCPPADQPGPHQLGCPQAEVPPSERPVNGLTTAFMPVPSLRASLEDPHDSPLAHSYRIPHDLPLGCDLTDAQVEQLGNPFLGGGA